MTILLENGGGMAVPFAGHTPDIAGSVFIAPGAIVIGNVTMAPEASLWFNAVVRGDVAPICVGARTNIQDGTIVHADPEYPTTLGEDVLIGHMAIIHGCTIHDGGFVGMGAIVMSGATIEGDAMLAAGAMLTGGKIVAARQLWSGRPARYVRDLTDDEVASMREGSAHYQRNAAKFRLALCSTTP